jgi:hypothetical protein
MAASAVQAVSSNTFFLSRSKLLQSHDFGHQRLLLSRSDYIALPRFPSQAAPSIRQRCQSSSNIRASIDDRSAESQSKCPFADVPGFPSSHSERTSVETKASAAATFAVSKPHKEIPGSYGLPFFGPLKDKLDYFAFKGWYKYIQGKKDKYNR